MRILIWIKKIKSHFSEKKIKTFDKIIYRSGEIHGLICKVFRPNINIPVV